jgi:pantetheine-phosphate adenylyltransferase
MSAIKPVVYAFSGDPITYGHLDIIKRAKKLFGKVIVAIGTNPDKDYTFTAKERFELAKQALLPFTGVKVEKFEGLLVDFAYEQGAKAIVKGVRDAQDFQYEQTLNSVGLSQNHGIETIVLFAKPELAHISSSIVKALQKSQGLVQNYVPLPVKVALEKKLVKQTIIGITGEIASGKTYLAEKLLALGKKQGFKIHNIDLDELAHQIQSKLAEPQYQAVRQQIVNEFGEGVQKKDKAIDRKKLGELVFTDYNKLAKLNQIMWKPVLVRLRKELHGKEGLIIINSALLAEAELLEVCNNRIVLIRIDKKTQKKRLGQRRLNNQQISRRIESQFSADKKLQLIEKSLQKHYFGTLWQINDQTNIEKFAKELLAKV